MGWTPKIHPCRRKGKVRGHTFVCGGKKHWLPANPRAAKTEAAKHYADWLAKQNRPAGRPENVGELAVLAKAQHPQRTWALNVWMLFGAKMDLDEIKVDHLEALAAWLKKKYQRRDRIGGTGLSAASIHQVIIAALAACRHAVDQEWLVRAPRRPRLDPAAQRPKDLSPTRLSALFAALPDRAGRLFRFCLEVGARPGEACRLTWDRVDLEAGVATLIAHKTATSTGRQRVLYLTPNAIDLLSKQPRTHSHIFVSRLRKPYTADGLRSILRRRGANPYQLRHTFAQFQSDNGVDDATLAGLMGHTGTQMVQRYRHIRAQRLRDAAASLTSPLQPLPADVNASAPDRPCEKAGRSRKGQRASARKALRHG